MNKNKRRFAAVTLVLVVIALAVYGCDKPKESEFEVRSVDRGGLLCANESGPCVESWNGSDIVVYSDAGSTQTILLDGETGSIDSAGSVSFSGNLVVAGPTAATTATPMAYANTAADAPDLLVVAKDGTPVVFVHNGGEAEFDGNVNADGNLDVDGTTNLDDVDIDLAAEFNIDGELVCIGATGDGGTADGDDDLIVKGDAEVDDTLDVDGDIDLDGDGFDVDITGGFSVDGDAASNVTVAGAGIDLTLESEAGEVHIKGDEASATGITLDADDAAGTGVTIAVGSSGGLNIGGGLTDIGVGTGSTADGDDDLLVAGDAEVDDTLDVDGDIDLDGDGFDVDITAGMSLDADGASNFSASTGDITVEAETGSVIIKGDEAAADSIYLDADEDAASGVDIDVGATNGLSIDGGLTDIGGGTYGTADGDNDLGVAGDVEVEGSVVLANGTFPLEYATAGYQLVFGTETMTDTQIVATGLTTVTWALCTLGVDVDTDAGDPVVCTVDVSANVVTVKLWQDDWSAAATASQTVHWMAIGLP